MPHLLRHLRLFEFFRGSRGMLKPGKAHPFGQMLDKYIHY